MKFLWLCANKSAVYPILCRKTERLGKDGITSTGRFKSMIAPGVQLRDRFSLPGTGRKLRP